MIRGGTIALTSCLAVMAGSRVGAADTPVYAPPPSWVKPVPLVEVPPAGGSIQLLLLDSQVRFEDNGSETYSEVATKALDPQGLAGLGNLILPWNPVTDTLTIHKVVIIRDGKTRNLLAGGKSFAVLRRESGLEASMLDGTLTATLQPDDLRVGDILDFAVTVARRDPALRGHGEAKQFLLPNTRAEHVYLRDIWPAVKSVRWLARQGLPPVVAKTGVDGEILVDAKGVLPPEAPVRAPLRYARLAQLQTSDYRDWAELSSLMADLFDQAATLNPKSPLKAEAARIRKAAADPTTRALLALQLVQDQVRYFYISLGVGGYTPAAADLTWSRRFGDCKGKTVLLLALLRELGISAEATLVNTEAGDGLNEGLPAAGDFNHAIVRASIGGKTYWLDGTRPRDRSLESIPIPDFHWALPLKTSGGGLEPLLPKPFDEPQSDTHVRLDARQGPDKPVSAHVEIIYRDDSATGVRLRMKQTAAAEVDRSLRQFWTGQYPWITADKVAFIDDEARGLATFTLDGSGILPWTQSSGYRQYRLDESSLGSDESFHREPGPFRDAPYSVSFPDYDRSEVVMLVPGNGAGYRLIGGADVDETVGGVEYKRRSRLEAGLVTMTASHRAIEPEFPNADGPNVEKTLRRIASADVVIVTSGGAAPRAETSEPPAVEAAPKDASDLTSRGAQHLREGKTDAALAEFSEAIRLEPKVAKRYYNRGVAYFEAGRDKEALADFNQSLKLDPSNSGALMARGELEEGDGREGVAKADMDRAVALAPSDAGLLLRRAKSYFAAWKIDAALADYEALLTRFPQDSNRYDVLGRRCWARAVRDRDVALTEDECREALKVSPNNELAHDALGVLALRRRDYDAALKEFGGALSSPDTRYIAFYGRSIAEASKGLNEAADDDRRASIALSPQVPADFHKMGF